MTRRKSKEVELELVKGAEGHAIYLGGYRIAGPKPWGGGTLLLSWKVGVGSIKRALKERPRGEK